MNAHSKLIYLSHWPFSAVPDLPVDPKKTVAKGSIHNLAVFMAFGKIFRILVILYSFLLKDRIVEYIAEGNRNESETVTLSHHLFS